MPVKKKQTLTDKSVKQSINIKIGDVRPKTKRVYRKRKPKTQIEVQPEVKTIYQTGLSRDIGAYTDEVNKRNEALKEEFKLKAKKEEEEAKKKAEEEAKKKVVLTAEVIPSAIPIVQGIVYDYKKNSVFNPESLEPKSTTISKEVIENKPLFSTERKPKEPVYDNKKYATPAGAFIPQSTTMGEKPKIPTPENVIEEDGEGLLYSTEGKPKEQVYDNKKYAKPAGAFFSQSTTISKEPIPTPKNTIKFPKGTEEFMKEFNKKGKIEPIKKPKDIIKERGRPLTDETIKFIRQTNKSIKEKREIYNITKNIISSGKLEGEPLENAKKKLNKLNDEIIQLEKILDEVKLQKMLDEVE